MRFVIAFLVAGLCVVVFSSLSKPSPSSIGVQSTIEYFKTQSAVFAQSSLDLQVAIYALSSKDAATVKKAREAVKECRLQYKRLEFFIEYFFKSSAVFFNGPPKYEVEEPYMEWQTPTGLQVIEALLYERNTASNKAKLLQQIEAVTSSAKDMSSLLYQFTADDQQILESMRLELVRIYTLGISGFDAPFLKSGIEESFAALQAIKITLQPFLEKGGSCADSVVHYLAGSLYFLSQSKDFNSFDRLQFLTQHGLPLQQHLNLLIEDLQLFLTTTPFLNYKAQNLFSPDAINRPAFSSAGIASTASLSALGKKLFFEKGLSGNNKISCATCHNPEKYFADALPKNLAFNGHSRLQRNTPSLFYAGLQHEQFWDGRAKTMMNC